MTRIDEAADWLRARHPFPCTGNDEGHCGAQPIIDVIERLKKAKNYTDELELAKDAWAEFSR